MFANRPLCSVCESRHEEVDDVGFSNHMDKVHLPHSIRIVRERLPNGLASVQLLLSNNHSILRVIRSQNLALLERILQQGGDPDEMLPFPWNILSASINDACWAVVRFLLQDNNLDRLNMGKCLRQLTFMEVHPMFLATRTRGLELFKRLYELNDWCIPAEVLNYILAAYDIHYIEQILTLTPIPNLLISAPRSNITPLHSILMNPDRIVFDRFFQLFLDQCEALPPTIAHRLPYWLTIEAKIPARPPNLTPFTTAIIYQNPIAARRLADLMGPAGIARPNDPGYTPLYLAARYINIECFKIITGDEPRTIPHTQVTSSAGHVRATQFPNVPDTGPASIDYITPLGGTILHALVRGALEMQHFGKIPKFANDLCRMASFLAQSGADPHCPHPFTHLSPLVEASNLGFADLARAMDGEWKEEEEAESEYLD
ncbi:uncharacterized protein BO80DRAFT_442905 [Aspergillus ibericus CBS 121593]|uniref:Ankyrin n=1 Tax=Aspergillus ibericus CBS 121593 TaxID=1448316 RepID=A0A395HAJ7_9EURO|nr:hypothetical protein BO80DRAFT_442905 [Aspergillus ibericus CBS 121593]RAL03224.1 hypothetical protein BO80DRAFT_442905 [Aspergillus ibericus CBS 121593]